MQMIRFNGTVSEFDSLNWEVGFQGFEQWLNKRTRLNPTADKIVVINNLGIIICTRWIIYDDLSIHDLRTV